MLSCPFHFSNSTCVRDVCAILSQPAFLHGNFSLRMLSRIADLSRHYLFIIQIFSSVFPVLEQSDLKIVNMVNWVIRICIHAHLWLYYFWPFSFSFLCYPVDNMVEIFFLRDNLISFMKTYFSHLKKMLQTTLPFLCRIGSQEGARVFKLE